MKKQSACLILFLLFAGAMDALAEGSGASSSDPAAVRTAELNRAMLRRFEAEYETLREADATGAPIIRTEMRKLSYKIKALADDSRRVESMLTEEDQAKLFMEDVAWKLERKSAEVERRQRGPEPGDRVWQMHERALEYVAQRRLEDAAKVYKEIILEDPDDDQAYLILGHVQLLMGRYPEAEQAFDNAIHIDPENRGEVAPFYENQILASPNDPQVHANLGIAYLMLGDTERARTALTDALSLDPDNIAAREGYTLLESL